MIEISRLSQQLWNVLKFDQRMKKKWQKLFFVIFQIKIQFQSKQKVNGPHVEGIWALDEKIDGQKVRKWTVQNYEIGWSTRIRVSVGCPRIHSFSKEKNLSHK